MFGNLIISSFLVLVSGFVSGMTVGMLSVDSVQLKVLEDEGSAEQKQRARKLREILDQHHLILVTLLLANSIALEALPIFLNKCVSEVEAVALSVTLILLFGEIIPQAACTGKHQMKIVMLSLPAVQVLMSALWPLAYPIARLLDLLVGETEGQPLYARSHLKALIRLHQKNSSESDYAGSPEGEDANNKHSDGTNSNSSALGTDEVVVIEGALDMASKHVAQVMVPIDQVYMLEESQRLTTALRRELLDRGHSRVPVYRRDKWNVKGLLYIKSLICIDSHEQPLVGQLAKSNKSPIFCHPQMSLYDLLNEFQRGRHMAFVTHNAAWHQMNWGREATEDIDSMLDDDRALLGIATLEDIIEELIQEEIYDEFDNYGSSSNMPDGLGAIPYFTSAGATTFASYNSPLGHAATLTKKVKVAIAPENVRRSFAGPGLEDLTERLLPPDPNLMLVDSSLKNIKTLLGLNQARKQKLAKPSALPSDTGELAIPVVASSD